MRGLAVSLLLIAATTSGAPSLLPLEEGATWEYQISDSRARGQVGRSTVRVLGKEQIDGVDTWKVETTSGGQVTKTEFLTADERGVFCHRRVVEDAKAMTFTPAQTILPEQLAIGVKWQLDDQVDGSTMRQEFSVVAEEPVVVPAGKFRAWRLQCARPWPMSARIERWFTPGVGVVKETTATHGPSGRLLQRVTRSLKQFSPGAGKPSLTVSAADGQPEAWPAPGEGPSLELATAVPAPPAISIAADPQITMQVSRTRDGEPVTQFRSDAPALFVKWSGEDLPVNSIVRIAWIAEDVGDLVEPNFVVDQTETEVTAPEFGGRFTLSRPSDGWAPGKYRLELYVGAALFSTVRVQITE
jgi:hypothetical protein